MLERSWAALNDAKEAARAARTTVAFILIDGVLEIEKRGQETFRDGFCWCLNGGVKGALKGVVSIIYDPTGSGIKAWRPITTPQNGQKTRGALQPNVPKAATPHLRQIAGGSPLQNAPETYMCAKNADLRKIQRGPIPRFGFGVFGSVRRTRVARHVLLQAVLLHQTRQLFRPLD